MQIKTTHHFSFKNHLQKIYHAYDDIDELEIKRVLNEFNRLNFSFSYTTPFLFAIDYTKATYVIMTDGCQLITKHNPQEFMEAGIPMLLHVFQKDDFKIYNEHIFSTNCEFLKSQPQAEHDQFVFSFNYRVRHKNGNDVPIFQKGCYITSKETGLPLYSIGIVLNISPFKKDTIMCQTIEKIENHNGVFNHQLITENYYYPNAEDAMLSKHERVILSYMAEGYSGKQIAHKMNISENTIANHRKNMLKKTNTKNMAELVAFAYRHQLI